MQPGRGASRPPLPRPRRTLSPSALQRRKARASKPRLGTRWAVWVGGIALALGGLFLIRYSIEAGIFGPGVRLTMAALLGLALVGGRRICPSYRLRGADRRHGRRLCSGHPDRGRRLHPVRRRLCRARRLRLHRPGAGLHPDGPRRRRHDRRRAGPWPGAGRPRPPRLHAHAAAGVVAIAQRLGAVRLSGHRACRQHGDCPPAQLDRHRIGGLRRRRHSGACSTCRIPTRSAFPSSSSSMSSSSAAVRLSGSPAGRPTTHPASTAPPSRPPSLSRWLLRNCSSTPTCSLPGGASVRGLLLAAMVLIAAFSTPALPMLHAAGVAAMLVSLRAALVGTFTLWVAGERVVLEGLPVLPSAANLLSIGRAFALVFLAVGVWQALRIIAVSPGRAASWSGWAAAVPLVTLASHWMAFGNLERDLLHAFVALVADGRARRCRRDDRAPRASAAGGRSCRLAGARRAPRLRSS